MPTPSYTLTRPADRSIFDWIKVVAGIFTMLFVTKTIATAFRSEIRCGDYLPPSIAGSFLDIQSVPLWVMDLITTGPILFLSVIYKREWATPYMMAYTLPLITYYSSLRGSYVVVLLGIILMIPVLELVTGDDLSNPTSIDEARQLNNRKIFSYITMGWVPLQLMLLVYALYMASVVPFQESPIAFAAFIASVGVNTGTLGINIAHELIHKDGWLEPALGKVLLCTVCYGHWATEHVHGHHKRVSTADDPATSRYGETFYSFWPRSVAGSWRSAWELESELSRKHGYSFFSVRNESLVLTIGSGLLMLASYRFGGASALVLFVGQSVVAFTMLEIINYIEHYALARNQVGVKKLPDGTTEPVYEAVRITHSWNADRRLTNLFLFKLQRHSDHHANAKRRYQILRSYVESPQMPTGYAGMLVLALCPPAWFAVMNPLVEQYRKTIGQKDDASTEEDNTNKIE